MPFVTGTGDLLNADVDALVNAVNTVGVMGKGIALQFKQKFPGNFHAYKHACDAGMVRTGKMFVSDTGSLTSPRWIINFPTKTHWSKNSQLEFITSGLDDLACVIDNLAIRSIAVPALGCGNGGLEWETVEPLIRKQLGNSAAEIILFGPNHSEPTGG